MLIKRIRAFCFLVVLLSLTAFVGGQKWQNDDKIRGNSFGLENFLFRTLDGLEDSDEVQDVKKVRPTVRYKVNLAESETLNDTENLNLGYVTSGSQSESTLESQNLNRKSAENTNAFKEVLRKPTNFSEKSKIATQETGTPRIRGRLVLKRRKRPLNSIQAESNDQIPNRNSNILKSGRISVYSQPPKLNIKPTTPSKRFRETSGSGYHQTPLNVNSVTSSTTVHQPEVTLNEPKIRFEQEREPLTTSDNQNLETTEKSSTINLKAFLKQQTETLSLSEILQTQNLSLADLLRGNKDASTILKIKSFSSTPPASSGLKINLENGTESTERGFVLKSEGQEKKTNNFEETTFKENLKKFKSKFSRPQYGDSLEIERKENQSRTKENLIETINTTKRTNLYASSSARFVPQNRIKLRNYPRRQQAATTHPESSSTFIDIKQSELNTTFPVSNIATQITHVPVYKKKKISFKNLNNSDLSLYISATKQDLQDDDPGNAIRWTNKIPISKKIEQKQGEENANLIKPTQEIPNESLEKESVFQMEFGTSTTKQYEDSEISFEEIQKAESKDELIELLKSKNNADDLKKILHSRNMSLEEILYNRKKSTVQTNIEELFTNHRIHKEISSQSTVVFETLPKFDPLNNERFEPPKKIEYDEPYAEKNSRTVDHINVVVRREGKKLELPSSGSSEELVVGNEPDDLIADTSNVKNIKTWKLSEKSLVFGNSYDYENSPMIESGTDKLATYRTTDFPKTEIIMLDTLERDRDTERKFKLNLHHLPRDEATPETEGIERSYIPPAVKSAIIASGVVMAIALFVFIAIFAACGWKQREIHLKGSSSFFTDGFPKTKKPNPTNSSSTSYFRRGRKSKKINEFDYENSELGTTFETH